MTTRFIRLPEVLHLTGLSRSTIYRMEGRGEFPKRRQLGASCVGWDFAEVLGWIDSRSGAATGEAP
jgi:prophage regulatory protein